jgi:competence protein ComGC
LIQFDDYTFPNPKVLNQLKFKSHIYQHLFAISDIILIFVSSNQNHTKMDINLTSSEVVELIETQIQKYLLLRNEAQARSKARKNDVAFLYTVQMDALKDLLETMKRESNAKSTFDNNEHHSHE